MKKTLLGLLAWLCLLPASFAADTQYKLLVLAMPGKYHYEYIPIARDSLERLAKLERIARIQGGQKIA